MTPESRQLELSEEQRERLIGIIQRDYSADSADLERRNNALRRWYRLWRNAQEFGSFPTQDTSNFSIPLVLWMVLAKIAKELDALLGDESEISVRGIGPSDPRRVEKVKRWMNWRIKVSLKLFKKLYRHLLQKWVMGTSIGYLHWSTRKRLTRVIEHVTEQVPVTVVDPLSGLPAIALQPITRAVEKDKEVIDYDGPEFEVENLEDWILPAQARSVEQADHFIRRVYLSIDDLLDLADDNKLDSAVIRDNLKQLRHLAETGQPTTDESSGQKITDEKAIQQGQPTNPQGRLEEVRLLNWVGRFRLNDEDERTQEVVVFYQDDLKKILGASRLVDLFPDGRRPFIHSQGIMDIDSFWGQGLAEILEPVSKELDGLHNLAQDAGEGAIGPVLIVNPASGINPENTKLEPYSVIYSADPNGVRAINLGQINLSPYVLLTQQLMAMAERLTALTDPQLGRQFDRPNAPRTYGQQALLQQESNVRLLLDIRLERENLRELLNRIWEMDKRFLPKPYFFRVTEESPEDVLTDEDMMAEYDFDIGPITLVSNRFTKMQELMQAIAIVTPLGQPQITVSLLKKLLEKLGHGDVAAMLPDLSKLAPPRSPDEENVAMLQGEDVDPHPADNDLDHIAKHGDFLRRMTEVEIAEGTTVATMNPGLAGRIESHIAEHQGAAKQKQAGALINAAVSQAVPAIGGNGGGGFNIGDLFQGQSAASPGQSQVASQVNTGGLNLQ